MDRLAFKHLSTVPFYFTDNPYIELTLYSHHRSLKKESKRFAVFQILHSVTCINLTICQRQLLYTSFRAEINLLQTSQNNSGVKVDSK